MTTIEFEEVNVRIAEDQPEYKTLPALYNPENGSMTFCCELTNDEKIQVFETGKIWIQVLTGGQPFHPINSSFLREDLIPPKNEP